MKTVQEHIDYIEDVFLRLTDTGICTVDVSKISKTPEFRINIFSNANAIDESTIMHFFDSLEDYYKFNEKFKQVLEQLKHDYEIESILLNDGWEYDDLMIYNIFLIEKNKNINESLPRQHTLDQLARVQKMSKDTDVGFKLSDGSKPSNPKKIDSYEKFMKRGKKFKPNQNLHPGKGKFNKL